VDDLIVDFITETNESLEVVDAELVRFEANPSERKTLDNIFRLVHTVKGTCGFLGLERLAAVAHAGETLLGRFRDGVLDVTPHAVTLVLKAIDRIKEIIAGIEQEGSEPAGNDEDLISELGDMSEGRHPAQIAAKQAQDDTSKPVTKPVEAVVHLGVGDIDPELGRALRPGEVSAVELEAAFQSADGPEWKNEEPEFDDDLGRALRPGEVSSAALEAAFQSAPAPDWMYGDVSPKAEIAPAPQPKPDSAAPAKTVAKSGESEDAALKTEQSIRVNVDVLESLMTLVSEMVLTRNQLLQISRDRDDAEFTAPLARLSALTGELQDSVMKTRMQPIGAAWKKLPRVIRDLSNELGKKIDLIMEGEATELDRQVLELIRDPLTHMVRNSADHGLEGPEERVARGKNAEGKIRLSAYHEGGFIIIRIADDGRGLNTARIREKLVEKSLISKQEADTLTEAQIHRYIFAPGFSTASKITNVSGRGVGMDVVRTNIETIGGQIDLLSIEGQGTTFTIKIPLTLAIVSALIVRAGNQRFAVPQSSVLELVRTGQNSEYRIERIDKTLVLRLREQLLPLVELGPCLNVKDTKLRFIQDETILSTTAYVMVIQVGESRFGLVVTEVLDTEEIVVKPLANMLRDIAVFSGATILGDGSVVLILDPNALSTHAGRLLEEASIQGVGKQVKENTTALLIFKGMGSSLKAVPLSDITRLEQIDCDRFEIIDGRVALQYRGRLMPIVPFADGMSLVTEGVQPLLVLNTQGYPMGLAVETIVDVVEETLRLELSPDKEGVRGTAVISGRACEVIDTNHYRLKGLSEHLRPLSTHGETEKSLEISVA
jgi:two-component system chemotaxis sensor kinase CheA